MQSNEVPAEAPHATLALGWAELRLGRRDDARRTWVRVSRQFPADSSAPIALIQAAELAAQAGDLIVARKLLDRVLEGYPASPEAEIARLSRSVVAMREGRAPEAVRDLRVLASSARPSLPYERRKLLNELTAPGVQGGPEHHLLLTNRYQAGVSASDEGSSAGAKRGGPSERPDTFSQFAAPFIDGAGDPETTPWVLHGLALAAAEDKAWPEVQTLSSHLIDRFPRYPSAPELLVGVADRAASARQWPIVRSSYQRLLAVSKHRALAPKAQVDFAEALLRTGDAGQARVELIRFMPTGVRSEDAPRALHLLAEVNEALDRPAEALAAYERLRRDYPSAEWTGESLLPYARLLQHAVGREKEARDVLEEVVRRTKGENYSEASFRLAQLLDAEGEHRQAVDWYMSAAYDTPHHSRWYGPALLGAGGSLAASNHMQAALVVYRNLLPEVLPTPLPRDGRPAEGLVEKVAEPELAAEAAYRSAELLRGAGQNADAVEMYLTAASLAPESALGWRGLVGAVRSLVAIGDWQSAAAIYHRLVDSRGDAPEIVAEAKNALGSQGRDTTRRARSSR